MDIAAAASLFSDSADAETLIAFALEKPRTWVFAHPKQSLSSEEEKKILGYASRRRSGEPVAYIRGMQEFRGRTFAVSPSVLIPRSSTEELITEALSWISRPHDLVKEIDTDIVALGFSFSRDRDAEIAADIGTGSGCIAVTLASDLPDLRLIATDNSAAALAVARKNAAALCPQAQIDFREGDCLAPLADDAEPFVIVSNPPYIPSGTALPKDVIDFEPRQALISGADGLDMLRRLVTQAKEHPHCQGILLECRSDQVGILTQLAAQ